MSYGVRTANIFDVLDSNDEDNASLEQIPEKQAPAKVKEVEKTITPVAAGVEARLKGNATAATANGPAGGRGRGEGRGRGGGRGGGRFTLRPPREETEGGEGGAGDRSSRGRGPRGKDLGKRHDNDRRDASGRGHELEKREGAGKGNWGTVEEEIAVQEELVNEEKTADPTAEEPSEAPVATPEAEPQKEEMTLEEYEKMREEKRAGLNKKPSTEVKADPKAFEGMKLARKVEDENELELSNKKQIGQRKSGQVDKTRKEKEVVETNFRIGQQESGRGGRGRGFDRGGRRDDRMGGRGERPDREDRGPRRSDSGQNGAREGGRGGRGGGFPGRNERSAPSGGRGRGRGRDGPAPAIDDASAFPTLGGKDSK